MCGIFGMFGHKEAGRYAYLGLYALQHRGEESAGIISWDSKKLHLKKGMGLVSDVFDEKAIKSLKGNVALGHVRYSTTGSSTAKNIQPFFVNHRKGHIVIAHNGNLTNTVKLRDKMEDSGSIFQTSMDSEVIAHLIASCPDKDPYKSVPWALSHLRGAYSLALMVNGMLVGARDPHGVRPLCLGKLDGAFVLASETCALDLIQAQYIRDIEPGEIVFITKKGVESIKPFAEKKPALCIFEFIYFARPDSSIFGKNVYLARKKLGENLAAECSLKGCDMCMPVPDSGVYASIGFAEKSGIPFEMGMIRNHYIGRTFIQPSQFIRDFRVRVKLNPVKGVLKDKKVIVIEDSIVRGTTSRVRVKTIRAAGAKEVHMGVSCPPIKCPCFYGIDFPTKRELIASRQSIDWIKDYIGLDSLRYLSLEGMLNAIPLPKENFCTACFTGKYPIEIPKRVSKKILEK